MKKFLSFILVLAMVLGCVSMVSFASDEVVGYKFTASSYGKTNGKNITNPAGQFTNTEAGENLGISRDYTLMNPNNYSIKVVFAYQYSKQFVAAEDSTQKTTTWTDTSLVGNKTKTVTVPAFTAVNFTMDFATDADGKVTIPAGAYTWTVSGTTYTNVETTASASNVFLRITPQTDLAAGDSFVLITNEAYASFSNGANQDLDGDGTKGDAEYPYDEETALTQADVDAFDIPVLGGDYISVTNRASQNYDARVNMLSTIQEYGDGTYYYSGWFRWREMVDAYQKVNVILEQVKDGTTSYPAVGGTTAGSDWFYATGTFTITDSASLTKAVLRVQTWSGASTSNMSTALAVDYDMDAVSLRKANDDGTFTGNLIADGDCALGPDTDWYANGATLSNPVATATTMSIATQPTKLEYEIGEELDTTGLELNVLYSNGVTSTVTTGYTIEGFDSTTAGEQTVTVNYNGLTASYAVTVLEEITGYKFSSAVDTGAAHYFTFEDNRFADDSTFTGRKTFSYVFYNTGSTTIKDISLRTVELINNDAGGWQYVNLVKTTNVLPGEKVILTTYADFTNGYTTIGYTDSTKTEEQAVPLSQISARFDVTFADETGDGTSNVLIAPAVHDANDFLLITERNFSNSGSTHVKYRGTLPAYDYKATSMSIATEPSKSTYYLGDTLDTTGLALNVSYQDGSTNTITEGFEVTGFDSATTGTKTITVTYGGLTATFTVTVNEAPNVAVKYTFITAPGTTRRDLNISDKTHFTAGDVTTFSGTVSKTYTFYNTTDKIMTVALNFAATVTRIDMDAAVWVYGATTESATIFPGETATLTITETFADGVPTTGYKATSYEVSETRVNKLFPQLKVTFGTAGVVGDYVVIAPADSEDAIFSTTAKLGGGSYSTAEYLKAIPAFDEINGAFKMEVDTTTTANNYPRVASLGINTNDIIEDETGRYILLQYRLYNMSANVKYFSVTAQTNWATIDTTTVSYPGNSKETSPEQAVQPYSSLVFSIRIEVNDDDTIAVNGGTTAALSTISLRFLETKGSTTDIMKYKEAGEVYYIQSLNNTSRKLFCYTPSYCTNFTVTPIKEKNIDSINTIAAAAPEIGSSIAFNIIVAAEDSQIGSARLKVTRVNGDNENVVTYLDPISVAEINGITFKKAWGTLVFKYTGINAQCMADDLTFELVSSDGTAVATKANYSVRTYAENVYTNGTNTALDNLLRDMLIYGAEAQKKINYNTDDLATVGTFADGYDFTDFDPATIGTDGKDITGNNATYGVKSVGLNISYVNRIYFRLVDPTKVTSVTINGTAATVDADGLVYTDEIMATGFDDVYTIVVTTSEGTATVSYNVNAYLAAKYNSTIVGNIVMALTNYGNSAVAYVNANTAA